MSTSTELLRIPTVDDERRSWVAGAVYLLLATLLGAALPASVLWSQPRFEASSSLVVTGVEASGRGSLYAIGRYAVERAPTAAVIAMSDGVADLAAQRLGEPEGALRDAVQAQAPTAQTVIEIVVEAPDPEQAVRRADAVAVAAAEAIVAAETPAGFPVPRLTATVLAGPNEAVDARMLDVRRVAVPGAVVGLLLGWLVLTLYRPGRWSARLAAPLPADLARTELRRIDQSVQFEMLGALLLGQSWRGLGLAALAVFGIFGYGFTGSFIPPLIVVVLAGIAGARDLRFAVGGILFAGVAVLPGRIDTVSLGVITPTVLEIAVAFGFAFTLVHWAQRRGGPAGLFTGPVLGVAGAVIVGALVGMANGIELSAVSIPARSMLMILTFFVFREAFRGRPHQLFALLLVTAAAASVMAIAAVPLNLELLTERSVDYVTTGADTADVSRLNTPVLELWTPLLVAVAAGVIRLRPVWLWALLLVPCLAIQGFSFDRATWATLIVLGVVVAALRGGSRALFIRAGALVVAGAVALGLMSAGALGPSGEAVALRLTSVLTGEALQEDSLADRVRENTAAVATLRESPLLGTGIGVAYGGELVSFDDVQNVVRADPRPWIHNQYLRIWLWMGALGLIAYGAVVVRVVAVSAYDWRRRGRAATLTVALGLGLAAVGAQSVFGTTLDRPSSIISIALALTLMELSAGRLRSAERPTVGPASPVLGRGRTLHRRRVLGA